MNIVTWNIMAAENWNELSNENLLQKNINRQKEAINLLNKYISPSVALLQEVLYESIPKEEINKNIFFIESPTSKSKDNSKTSWGTVVYINPELKCELNDITKDLFPKLVINNRGKIKAIKMNIDNEELIFCSIHINTDGTGLQQLKDIFNEEIKQKKNIIIAGDFNCDRFYNNGEFNNFFADLKNNSNIQECEPLFKQTFFRGRENDINILQDDHIFVSNELYSRMTLLHKDNDIEYKGKTFNYGIIKNISDHTFVYAIIDEEK
jgi:endonuclease/exonuclease/phosphatase family metal-dependent hydrolase